MSQQAPNQPGAGGQGKGIFGQVNSTAKGVTGWTGNLLKGATNVASDAAKGRVATPVTEVDRTYDGMMSVLLLSARTLRHVISAAVKGIDHL